MINQDGDIDSFYPYLNDVYQNESNYPHLKKIVDSREQGYKKLQIKVFEIEYNLLEK